jgi:pimeloyl-ACP methyl ester carboxylesterase
MNNNEITWQGENDRIIFSPELGGRIISWRHLDIELVNPSNNVNGGLARILFADERYPGASYITPHILQNFGNNDNEFFAEMKYYWNTPNIFSKLFGWFDKINPLYIDEILLDKTIRFLPKISTLIIEIKISNLSKESKIVVPWMHNSFSSQFDNVFMVINGVKTPYVWMDIFWAGHKIKDVHSARLVAPYTDNQFFLTFGAEPANLAGIAAYTKSTVGPEFSAETCIESRFSSITLNPGTAWRTTNFIAVSKNPECWYNNTPVVLSSTIDSVNTDFSSEMLMPILSYWALPCEKTSGLMVISHLDKIPFSTQKRYTANNSFSFFSRQFNRAQSSVILIPFIDTIISAVLVGSKEWFLINSDNYKSGNMSINLKKGHFYRLMLEGPSDLHNHENIQVFLKSGDKQLSVLSVESDASVEKTYSYQVKQVASYIEDRFKKEKTGFHGNTAEKFWKWQKKEREKHLLWLKKSVTKKCSLSPRLMERQIGPTCIRDKILVQTEPGVWIPSYVVYPKKHQNKMPAVIFFHGSGPGKQLFVPDEDPDFVPLESGHELESMPYRLAAEKGYLVYCPDQRGWGEWGEGSYAQRPGRAQKAGYNITGMMMWDHIRSIDYLCSRADVDVEKIGCFGSSGGGWATLFTAGIDTRIIAAIISSSVVLMPYLPDKFFYRFEEFKEKESIHPEWFLPSATVYTAALTIPRALWIMDGKNDTSAVNANVTKENSDEISHELEQWRIRVQYARDELARLYSISGASEKLLTTWFDGGHCAGMTFENVAKWFDKWFMMGIK